MSHIVNSCPLTKFDGGLLRLHEADEAADNWLTTWILAYNNEVAAAKLSDYTRASEVCSSSTIAGLVGSVFLLPCVFLLPGQRLRPSLP